VRLALLDSQNAESIGYYIVSKGQAPQLGANVEPLPETYESDNDIGGSHPVVLIALDPEEDLWLEVKGQPGAAKYSVTYAI